MKAPGNKEKASCRVEWKDLWLSASPSPDPGAAAVATMAAVGIIAFLLPRFWLK